MNSKMLRGTVWYKSTGVSEKPAGFNFTKHEINIQCEHKVFPRLQTFITRKLLYVEYKLFF